MSDDDDPLINDLATTTTDQLLEELNKRFDVVVFVAYKPSSVPGQSYYKSEFYGSHPTALGLVDRVRTEIVKDWDECETDNESPEDV